MKKTTKILLVLAAVVAMTIGAVSTVMAADQQVVRWEQDDYGKWIGYDANDAKISSGWAVDYNNHWAYFVGGYALCDDFIKWEGNYYYFGKDCIMAEGWVKFDTDYKEKLEAVGIDYRDTIDGFEVLEGDKKNNDHNPYNDYVWMFFEKGGTAAIDEWVEVDGLWYYFEEIIMIRDTTMYEIEDVCYGFSGDGNMHVGWVEIILDENNGATGPTYSEWQNKICWTYYETNGTMAKAGWKQIDGEWYYFVANTDTAGRFSDNGVTVGTTVILQDAYVKDDTDAAKRPLSNLDVDDKTNGAVSYFYFTPSGAMAKGEVKFGKKDKYYATVDSYLADTTTSDNMVATANNEAYYYFDTNTGVQKFGAIGNNYYAKANESAKIFGFNKAYEYIYNVRTEATDVVYDVAFGLGKGIEGQKIFDSFRIDGNNTYYYDAAGNIVKSDVVDFWGVTVGFDKDGKMYNANYPDGVRIGGRMYYFNQEYGVLKVNGAIKGFGCHDDGSERYDIVLDESYKDIVKISAKKAVYGTTVTITPVDPAKAVTKIDATNARLQEAKKDGTLVFVMGKGDVEFGAGKITLGDKNDVKVAKDVKVSVSDNYLAAGWDITVSASESGKEITSVEFDVPVKVVYTDANGDRKTTAEVTGAAVNVATGEIKVGATVVSTNGKVTFEMPDKDVTVKAATTAKYYNVVECDGVLVDRTTALAGEIVNVVAENGGQITTLVTDSTDALIATNQAVNVEINDVEYVTGATITMPSANVKITSAEIEIYYAIEIAASNSQLEINNPSSAVTNVSVSAVRVTTPVAINVITAGDIITVEITGRKITGIVANVALNGETKANGTYVFTMPDSKVVIADIYTAALVQ